MGGLILAQYFYLPAWIQSLLPSYWHGGALVSMTVRHLLLLALLQAAYYWACRRLVGLPRGASFLLSLVFVYNARTLDAFRYGTGLDATVWGHLVVFSAIAHLLRPNMRQLVLVAASTQFLLTCGYPVLVPFFALAGIMGALLLVPSARLPLWAMAQRAGAVAGGCRHTKGVATLVTTGGPAAPPRRAPPRDQARANAANRLLVLQPNRVRLAVDSPEASVLVTPFPDQTPYWSASLDGTPTPLVLVDGAFLGVRVPPGRHVVEVRYFSTRMLLGLRVFLATAGLLVLAGVWLTARRVQPARPAWGVLGVAMAAGLCLLAARNVEARYVERTQAEMLLPNSYQELLRLQLARWNQ